MALDTELDAGDGFRADFERDPAGIAHEDAVSAVGQVERDVLVGLLAARSTVPIPDVDRLAILDQRSEPFAEPVDAFPDAEAKLLDHVVVALGLDDADALGFARGEDPTVGLKGDPPLAIAIHPGRQTARGELGGLVGRRHHDRPRCRRDRKLGLLRHLALEVRKADADDVRQRRSQPDGHERAAQGVAAVLDLPGRRVDRERVQRLTDVVRLGRMPGRDAGAHPPEAIGELHRLLLTFRESRRCHVAGDPLQGTRERASPSRAAARHRRERWRVSPTACPASNAASVVIVVRWSVEPTICESPSAGEPDLDPLRAGCGCDEHAFGSALGGAARHAQRSPDVGQHEPPRL